MRLLLLKGVFDIPLLLSYTLLSRSLHKMSSNVVDQDFAAPHDATVEEQPTDLDECYDSNNEETPSFAETVNENRKTIESATQVKQTKDSEKKWWWR